MRVWRWVAFIVVLAVMAFGYIHIAAHQSGLWVDRVFAELSQKWDAKVVFRNAKSSAPRSGSSEGLQLALDNLKSARLEEAAPATCTHGVKIGDGEGVGMRSRCVLLARFDKGVVEFEFELAGYLGSWKISGFDFHLQGN